MIACQGSINVLSYPIFPLTKYYHQGGNPSMYAIIPINYFSLGPGPDPGPSPLHHQSVWGAAPVPLTPPYVYTYIILLLALHYNLHLIFSNSQ